MWNSSTHILALALTAALCLQWPGLHFLAENEPSALGVRREQGLRVSQA